MIRFLIRRAVFGILTLWVIVTAVFVLYYVAPHDVARTIAGRAATPALLHNIHKELGLDKPLPEQYKDFLGRLIPWPGHFDLKASYITRVPVLTTVVRAIPVDISTSRSPSAPASSGWHSA
jgi:peptide/nickel transport system permease protein